MYSRNYFLIALISVIIWASGCSQEKGGKEEAQEKEIQSFELRSTITVETGNEVLFNQYIDELKGKTIGLVINHTAVDKKGVNIVDRFMDYEEITIKAIFAPEHGYRGDQMGKIEDETDLKGSEDNFKDLREWVPIDVQEEIIDEEEKPEETEEKAPIDKEEVIEFKEANYCIECGTKVDIEEAGLSCKLDEVCSYTTKLDIC